MSNLKLEKSLKHKEDMFVQQRQTLERKLKDVDAHKMNRRGAAKFKTHMKRLVIKQKRFSRKNKKRSEIQRAVEELKKKEQKKNELLNVMNELCVIETAIIECKLKTLGVYEQQKTEIAELKKALGRYTEDLTRIRTECKNLQNENLSLREQYELLVVDLRVAKTKHDNLVRDIRDTQSAQVLELFDEFLAVQNTDQSQLKDNSQWQLELKGRIRKQFLQLQVEHESLLDNHGKLARQFQDIKCENLSMQKRIVSEEENDADFRTIVKSFYIQTDTHQ